MTREGGFLATRGSGLALPPVWLDAMFPASSAAWRMSQTRRTFLTTLGAAAAGLATGRRAFAAPNVSRAKISRIGIQLYTLRRAAEPDLAGVLGSLAKIGYKEVEFDIVCSYIEEGFETITDTLESCRITKDEGGGSQGADPLTVSWDLDIMNILWDGEDSLTETLEARAARAAQE